MRSRVSEADATDCSKLAWLLLNGGDDDGAREITKLGLQKDPHDHYCNGLAARLGIQVDALV